MELDKRKSIKSLSPIKSSKNYNKGKMYIKELWSKKYQKDIVNNCYMN